MLERPAVEHPAQLGDPPAVRVAEHLHELLGRPHVERALRRTPVGTGGVGVQRGREPALGGAQVGQQPLGGLLDHTPGQRVRRGAPPVRVDPQELCVVVEHLLEVRHHPRGVHAVPREPARQLVVDPAAGHRLQRALGHPGRGRGAAGPGDASRDAGATPAASKAGTSGAPEPATRSVVHGGYGCERGIGHHGVEGRTVTWLGARARAGGDLARAAEHLRPPRSPRAHDCLDDVPERRYLPDRVRGIVRTREERLAVRSGPHRHRPTPVAGQGLGRRHVHGVDVGTLLPVHLHRDDVGIEVGSHRSVLERLVRHHVAPVAGRVADRDQDGDVAALGLGERLGPPLPPVDRVARVLAQVGAGRCREAVGHAPQPGVPRRGRRHGRRRPSRRVYPRDQAQTGARHTSVACRDRAADRRIVALTDSRDRGRRCRPAARVPPTPTSVLVVVVRRRSSGGERGLRTDPRHACCRPRRRARTALAAAGPAGDTPMHRADFTAICAGFSTVWRAQRRTNGPKTRPMGDLLCKDGPEDRLDAPATTTSAAATGHRRPSLPDTVDSSHHGTGR